jgi:hypothetical protein
MTLTSTVVAIGLVLMMFFIALSLFVKSCFRNAPPDPEEIELNRRDLETLAEIRRRQSTLW